MTQFSLLNMVSLVIALALALVFPLILDGIGRKIKARIQYRMGPPISQTIYDLFKLLKTPSIIVGGRGFILAPYIAFASALVATTMLPVGTVNPISFSYDVFVFIYVLSMVSVALMVAGFSVQNTYANIGANREMILILSTEPILGVAIAMLVFLSKNLSIRGIIESIRFLNPMYIPLLLIAYVILVYVVYVEGGFIPFDVAEAETEIIEGPLCEYSGKLLGLFKWALLIKRFVLIWFLASLITIPLTPYTINGVASYIVTLLLQLFASIAIYSCMVANEALTARYKIDWVISTNKYVFLISLVFLLITVVVVSQ